jgi:thioredoxin-like negative regulator of GroEL
VEKLSPEIAGLVTEGLLGTAVDTLELRIRQRPADFDLRLELAQVWILNCDYPGGAERIIAAIECDQRFTAAQKAAAKAQLVLWSKKYAEQNTLQLTCNAPVPNEVTAA